MKTVVGTVIAVVVASMTAAGCGGSKSKTTTRAPSTTTHASAPVNAGTATTATLTSGPVHATLHGANHTPTARKSWVYTVRVTDANGKPLSGTVETDFAFAGIVVGKETPPVHRLKDGFLRDVINYPSDAIGHPITLVTVIHTSEGSVALGWPVTVKK
jgi:hypothetical protein